MWRWNQRRSVSGNTSSTTEVQTGSNRQEGYYVKRPVFTTAVSRKATRNGRPRGHVRFHSCLLQTASHAKEPNVAVFTSGRNTAHPESTSPDPRIWSNHLSLHLKTAMRTGHRTRDQGTPNWRTWTALIRSSPLLWIMKQRKSVKNTTYMASLELQDENEGSNGAQDWPSHWVDS